MFVQNTGAQGFPIQTLGVQAGSVSQLFGQGVAPGQAQMSMGDLQQLLGAVLSVFAQLGGNWGALAGQQQQQTTPAQQQQLAYMQQGVQNAYSASDYWKQQAYAQLDLASQVGVQVPGAGQLNPAMFGLGGGGDMFGYGGQTYNPYGQQQPQQPYYGGQGWGQRPPQQQQYPSYPSYPQYPTYPSYNDPYANNNPYGTNPYGTGGTTTPVSNPPQNGYSNGTALIYPGDRGEFGAYLAMQVAGGALQGNTSVSQRDATPGTRMAYVQDPTQWHASVGRAYAYQFAAQAGEDSRTAAPGTYNPLSAEGLAAGANYFESMSPDARIFAQVASVFKGNLMNGPGNYNNATLKDLLLQKAQQTGDPELRRLAGLDQVGKTDVQTIGAITNALNSGKLTLNEIIASGAIAQADMPRYNQIIQYVTNGSFNHDLSAYDANPFPQGGR